MLKRRSDVNPNIAFLEACEENGIKLTPKYTNPSPVMYIDDFGNKKIIYVDKKNVKQSRKMHHRKKKPMIILKRKTKNCGSKLPIKIVTNKPIAKLAKIK